MLLPRPLSCLTGLFISVWILFLFSRWRGQLEKRYLSGGCVGVDDARWSAAPLSGSFFARGGVGGRFGLVLVFGLQEGHLRMPLLM